MHEGETKSFKETEMDPDTFEVLLRFMYTDLVDDDAVQANGEDLLRGANFYVLQGLKMRCEVALCKELTVENVASRLLLADQTEADMLKEACLEFIKPNAGAVMTSPGWACIPAHNGGLLLQEVTETIVGVHTGVAGKKRTAAEAGLSSLTPGQRKEVAEVEGMKVGQLREALEQRGLDTAGLKAQLVERLTEAICGGSSSSGSSRSTAIDVDQ